MGVQFISNPAIEADTENVRHSRKAHRKNNTERNEPESLFRLAQMDERMESTRSKETQREKE